MNVLYYSREELRSDVNMLDDVRDEREEIDDEERFKYSDNSDKNETGENCETGVLLHTDIENRTENNLPNGEHKCQRNLKSKVYTDCKDTNIKVKYITTDVTNEAEKDMDTGWAWAVLLASFGTSCIIGGALYTIGIIQAILLDLFNGDVSTTSLVGALHTSLISITGPVSSAMTDRFSCRVAIVLSGFLYLAGYLGTAFAPNIEVAILTCGVISGLAGGLAYTANMVIISFYFKRRRHLALGISSSGLGIGLFIFAPTLQFLRDYYGPRGVFILMAGVFLHIVLFGVICVPSRFELVTQQRRNNIYKQVTEISMCVLIKSYIQTLFNKGIFCYCISTFSLCLGVYVMYMFYPEFIIDKGYTAYEAANLISISGICNVIGRILSGIMVNFKRVNGIVLFSLTLFIVAIATWFYVMFSDYYVAHVIYFVLLGLFIGPSAVLQTNVSLKFIPVDNISQAIGLQLSFAGVGAIIGPVLAGMFVDRGGSYEHVLITAAVFVFLGGVASFVTVCFKQIDNESQEILVKS
ncbi:hypothetical protein ACF0H5_008693 [Mactra antiquata]